MYPYANDSIIVINYSTHVIYTIWQSLKVFSCFYQWIPLMHPSHTLILFTHLSNTQTHVPLIHIRNQTLSPTYIQLTHLLTTHVSHVRLPHTQLSLTWIQRSIKCHSHTYHLYKYHSLNVCMTSGYHVDNRTVFRIRKYLFFHELDMDI